MNARQRKRERQKQARAGRKQTMRELRAKLHELTAAKELGPSDIEAIREWAAREDKKRAGVGRPGGGRRWLT